MIRRWFRWLPATALLLIGCQSDPAARRSTVSERLQQPEPYVAGEPAAVAPAALTQPESQPPEVLATVNDRAISTRRYRELLENSHGLFVLEQLIALEVVRTRAAVEGISVSAAEIDKEYWRALQEMAWQAAPQQNPADLPAIGQQMLDALLAEKNISLEEFKLSSERNAYLRKMVEQRLAVDETELQRELDRAYGPKAVVRHMVLPDLTRVAEVRRRLDAGEDFAELAATYSTHRLSGATGGLLAPFGRHDPQIPPALREVAFALQPGDVSGAVRVNQEFHLLRLERFIAADSGPVDAARREEMKRRLLDARSRAAMRGLEQELFQEAHIHITDPDLNQQFRRRHP